MYAWRVHYLLSHSGSARQKRQTAPTAGLVSPLSFNSSPHRKQGLSNFLDL